MKMDSQQLELYQRIQKFSFDQPEAKLSFSKRLAKENGWSISDALRAIEEYKKFAFLAVVAGHPVTPSDPVDQVWHLHLTYTRSYWQEFCPTVLQTSLHHEPTRGGSSEALKFGDWYRKTLESYQQFFGQSPPTDIWSKPEDRFGQDLHFVRVNTQTSWLMPKLRLSCIPKVPYQQAIFASFVFTLAFVITGCQIVNDIPNPLNFTGSEFLTFYFLLSALVGFLAFLLRTYLRLPAKKLTQQSVSLDVYETAYLAEGKNRVVDTAIASLLQKEAVVIELQQRTLSLTKSAEESSHPVEQAVAKAIAADGQLDIVRSSVTQVIDGIQNRLWQLNLLVSEEQSPKVKNYPALLIVALLGLGIAKVLVGISRGKPVGYLIAMCVGVIVMALYFWQSPPHRSRYGDRVLADLRTHVSPKVASPTDPQFPLQFAIFGIIALPNSGLAELRELLTPVPSSNGGGSSDSSSGGCGSGCGSSCSSGCGGGCGGCSG